MPAMKTWLCLAIVASSTVVRGSDWPTFRHDNHRSGNTAERLPANLLQQQWVWRSPTPPRPAWAGPAKWDAYANIKPLRSMRNYDPVFHVIAAGGSLYFGSSADDSVHCLDAATGKEKWSYTTDGPVRIAPTYSAGKLYFGSDDGFAYCLKADDGSLVWKYVPMPCKRRILNNGRLITLWPCRTGVLVDGREREGDTAYFGAGMLPWKESYLCAVDARTGKPQGPGRYVQKQSGVTMEGALLASADRLFSPQGRVPPLLFDRAAGKRLGSLDGKGGGGCFVLLTGDSHVLHGPGNKTGWISDSDARTRTRLASFAGGNAMVVDGKTAYLLSDYSLAAIDRASRKTVWNKPCKHPYELVLAGDALFAGGRDSVAAFAAKDGTLLWEGEVFGKAYGLVVAGGRLLVSTDEGAIYCFRPGPKPVPLRAANLSPPADSSLPPPEEPALVTLALGPYLQFTGPETAVVRWETEKPSPTILEYHSGGDTRRVEDATPKTEHELTLTELRKDTAYYYVIKVMVDKEERGTVTFECDNFFNYHPPAVRRRARPSPADAAASESAKTAEEILSCGGVRRGICLVLGSGDGRLAGELARQSRLRIIGVDTDPGAVASARRTLQKAGIYGSRVAIHRVDSLKRLPFVGNFANLIVSDREHAPAEAVRLLRPGGVALSRDEQGSWVRTVRPPLENTGVWSHQYGRPDNSAYGGESLQGAGTTDELQVQWLGRPGPRAQADRNGRKPSPLSTGGRLFMQGLHRIIAIDAYNGTILWSLEIPQFQRFNMPRDCSNWCADRDHVFAAIRDKCWRIDAADGKLSKTYPVIPASNKDWKYDWGYLASHANSLIGSAVKQGTSWVNFFGGAGAGWYDAAGGPVTHKICSDKLFSLNKQSGKVQWTYSQGLVINPTITIGDGRIYFVECRNAKVIGSDSRRVGMAELWLDQFLVALDISSGKKLWEVPLDTADGVVVFYLACGGGKLVLVSSDNKYHVYAFDARSGSPAWDVHFDWPGKDHGKHMSRPAIAGGNVFVRPKVIELATGRFRKISMPDGGCGTYALTDGLVIFRAGNVTLWDFQANKRTAWPRLRPGCWVSTIPAGGMLLSPEAGGGCSCGNWMETSVGFIPKSTDK